jgi:predicted 3-demethylubiquinone-9 3-methyltransferase (glyoxalase superfamily)
MNNKITSCLGFDTQAEEAARFYVSVFPNSKITSIAHYPQAMNGKQAGDVLIVAFELNGHSFTALNGGPFFKFSEGVSFQIDCATQNEVDYYWEKLSAGGDPTAQQCSWLADKFGVFWQVVPSIMQEILTSADEAAKLRGFQAMLGMKKLDIAALQHAFKG